MALGTITAFAVPALASLLGSWLSGRNKSGTPQNPQLMNQQNPQGFPQYQLPNGGTAVGLPNFNPQQMSMLSQLGSSGLSGLQSLQGLGSLPSASFAPIEQAARSQFQQQTVPGIAEQFTGAGAGGQRSSAFTNALGAAGAGLDERLAAMKQGFNMQERQQLVGERGQEINRLMNMLKFGLTPQYSYQGFQRQPGFGESLVTAAAPGAIKQGIKYGIPELMKYLGG